MKKQSRLTALLLALCMLMSTLPVSALADGILTLEDYLSAVQRVQQADRIGAARKGDKNSAALWYDIGIQLDLLLFHLLSAGRFYRGSS